MEVEFIEPSPKERAKLVLLGLVVVAGYVAIDIYWPSFMGFVKGLPLCEQLPWLRGWVVAFVAIVASIAAMLGWQGYRILHARQLPLPGALVFRRTKIRRGAFVLAQGYAFCALALALVVGFACLLPRGWSFVYPLFLTASACNGA